MDASEAHRPTTDDDPPLRPTETARWVLPVLLPLLLVNAVLLLGDGSRSGEIASTTATAVLWGGTLVLGLLACAVLAVLTRRDRPVPRGPIIRAVAVAAFFVLLTSVSARSQPIAAELQRNWQGKVMDLLWVVILCMILHRWARQETGLLRLPAPGSRRVALRVVGGVSALFVALGLLAAATGDAAQRPVDLEQLAWDATLPNLTEEIIWRGVMLAVLDRALPPTRRVLGAPLGWGAVMTSAVFALGHLIQLGGDGSWSVSIAGGVFAAVMGLALAWIRARTGSIWPAFALHCAPELGADAGLLLGT